MPSFDYITAKEFRQSLEADHREMRSCADAQAWKSVQVLAGSIVESLLIDYLVSTAHASRPKKDPLKLDLAEAITICRSEGALSERTADLCSVIRSYRNLIHPGRMVRLGEQAPSQGSSSIAMALVDLIADELASVRRAAVGLTAEQIVSKVQRDADSLTILKHLLQEVSEQQKERLVRELIPAAHLHAIRADVPFDSTADRLESAHRVILESASNETHQRFAADFVKVLREEDGDSVARYSAAFFRPADLEFVPGQHLAMVKEHLLGRNSGTHNLSTLKQSEGMGELLEEEDVMKWLDPIVRTLSSAQVKDVVKQRARSYLFEESTLTSAEVDTSIDRRLDDWIKHYDKSGAPEKAEYLRGLMKDLVAQRIPV